MRIEKFSLIEGARKAKGLAVVIDVFRAFTTAAFVMANGAEMIVPVGTVEESFEFKERHPDWIQIGERGGVKVKGFQYGNSPYEVSAVDFTGRTVIQTTSAGVQGIVNAMGADDVVLGSFVMAGAIVEYIRKMDPDAVSLVAMGDSGVEPNEEDERCADYIESLLVGGRPDFEEIRKAIWEAPSGFKFFDPEQPQFREEDLHMALDLDRFPFILRVVDGEESHVEKVDVPPHT